jgi:CHASE2 domain-containing sensor protein
MIKRFSKYAPFLIALLLIIFISYFRPFEHYELATLDVRYQGRPRQPMNPDVLLVEIGEDSIQKIGRWPFSRDWHATLVNILAHYGAKAVFFDVIFGEEETGDEELREASTKIDVYYPIVFESIEKKGSVLTAARYDVPLLEAFARVAKKVCFINTPVDCDGKVRRMPLSIEYKGNLYPAASLALAGSYTGYSLDDFRVPTDEDLYMLINFPAKWKDSFNHLSYVDIITSHYLVTQGQEPVVDLSTLKDKVCFIGLTATGTHDIRPVPMETLYPGVGVHASAFNTLVMGAFIARADRVSNILIAILLGVLIAVFSMRFKPFIGLGIVSACTVMFIIVAFCLFAFLRIWIDLFFPLLLMPAVYLYTTFFKYTSERKKRELIEKELSVAKTIQQSFLPDQIPEAQNLEVAARMLTARHVGGDLYDFVDYKDGTLGIMVGDVSGKGVPAALFMAKAVSEFRIFSKDKRDPATILLDLNKQLLETSKTNLFVTMCHVCIDTATRSVTYASGGHLPLVLARGEAIELLEAKEGMALGLFESEFSDEKLSLERDDVVVLYTDGVTEAINLKGEEYGTERLTAVVKKNKNLPCKEIVDLVYKDITHFTGKAPQHDDITVIVIKAL